MTFPPSRGCLHSLPHGPLPSSNSTIISPKPLVCHISFCDFLLLLPPFPLVRTTVYYIDHTRINFQCQGQLTNDLNSIFNLNSPLPGNQTYSQVLEIRTQRLQTYFGVHYPACHNCIGELETLVQTVKLSFLFVFQNAIDLINFTFEFQRQQGDTERKVN